MTDAKNEGVTLTRLQLTLVPGSLVLFGKDVCRVLHLVDFKTVVIENPATERKHAVAISDLLPVAPSELSKVNKDLNELSVKDWAQIRSRLAVIEPFLDAERIGRSEVQKRAAQFNVNAATIYRWIKSYRAFGSSLALLSKSRGWPEGKSRLDPQADMVIDSVINDYYLTVQRPSAEKAINEVNRRCHELGINAPSSVAIRKRLSRIPERELLKLRGFREKSKNKFNPVPGSFPGADYPLAVMQIDHTPLDIILVDDAHRQPIGRPWLTLSIDVHSRVVTGFYLSFDPPSETSVAMCVACSILDKSELLLEHQVDHDWPVWGIPQKIHVDNGAEFRSDTFRKACDLYKILLEYRPVKQPQYGGHIERLLGTILTEIHGLPGTTFSSVHTKDEYKSEAHASMTKQELTRWLLQYICSVYHQRLHTGINMSPIRKWEIGIFGYGDVPGVGVQPLPKDRNAVALDFLPSFERTVQADGVTVEGLSYYSEVLRPWINAVDPLLKATKRSFVFRRDPRDISVLWFRDPDTKAYYKIPLADMTIPSMSAWEFHQVKSRLRKEGETAVNKAQILQGLTAMRQLVDDAKARTKKARRQAQRQKEHQKIQVKNSKPELVLESLLEKTERSSVMSNVIPAEEIEDFGDFD